MTLHSGYATKAAAVIVTVEVVDAAGVVVVVKVVAFGGACWTVVLDRGTVAAITGGDGWRNTRADGGISGGRGMPADCTGRLWLRNPRV